MDWLKTYFEAAGMSPSTASALIIGFIMTYSGYVLRELPLKVYRLLMHRISYEVTIDNSGWDSNDLRYRMLADFILNQDRLYSRSLYPDGYYDRRNRVDKFALGLGTGNHWFVYRGRPVRASMHRLKSEGTAKEKKEIILTIFGGTRAIAEAIVKEATTIDSDDIPAVFIATKDGFQRTGFLRQRRLNTVTIPEKTKVNITSSIEEFFESEKWYVDNGIPYKLSILLEGPPGTGKTSLARAIATQYNRPLAMVSASYLDTGDLSTVFSAAPEGSIILVEDIHTSEVCKSDGAKNDKSVSVNKLGDLLSAIDGASPLHDKVIIMTTNNVECLAEPLMRPGRVDHRHHIGYLERDDIIEYIHQHYPGEWHLGTYDLPFRPMKGCDLQSAFMENRDDLSGFIRTITGIKKDDK